MNPKEVCGPKGRLMSKMEEYMEGDECPFCEAEYNDFFSHSEGLGSYSETIHYYYCQECGKAWRNREVCVTEEVE